MDQPTIVKSAGTAFRMKRCGWGLDWKLSAESAGKAVTSVETHVYNAVLGAQRGGLC